MRFALVYEWCYHDCADPGQGRSGKERQPQPTYERLVGRHPGDTQNVRVGVFLESTLLSEKTLCVPKPAELQGAMRLYLGEVSFSL